MNYARPDPGGPLRAFPHKVVLELRGRYGQAATGPLRCVVSFGAERWEASDDRIRWDDREPAKPHYYVFFPDGFTAAPKVLEDGRYEVAFYEQHGVGWKLRHEAHAFEVRDGEVVVPPEPLAGPGRRKHGDTA